MFVGWFCSVDVTVGVHILESSLLRRNHLGFEFSFERSFEDRACKDHVVVVWVDVERQVLDHVSFGLCEVLVATLFDNPLLFGVESVDDLAEKGGAVFVGEGVEGEQLWRRVEFHELPLDQRLWQRCLSFAQLEVDKLGDVATDVFHLTFGKRLVHLHELRDRRVLPLHELRLVALAHAALELVHLDPVECEKLHPVPQRTQRQHRFGDWQVVVAHGDVRVVGDTDLVDRWALLLLFLSALGPDSDRRVFLRHQLRRGRKPGK